MRRRAWLKIAGGAAAATGLGAVTGRELRGAPVARTPATRSPAVPVFALRNPGCGCCEGWADHLRENGFEVALHDTDDLQAVKQRLGVPEDLHGCHTALVAGYVVEGHVPAAYVRRILDESPDVAGVAVPGMPAGSPGMEGPPPVAYDVVAFGRDGERTVLGTEGA